jgi:hypothetical protein
MSNKYPIKNIDEAMSSNDLLKKFWEESKPKQGNLLKKPTVDTNKSFMEEAKKYKSAEEFVKAQ